MNHSREFTRKKHRRASSAFLFVAVAVVGLWVHYHVLPVPVRNGPDLVLRFAYFLAWLGTLIHLIGQVIFGNHLANWHSSVFFLLGGFFGVFGGLLFAGYLGFVVGGLSGVIVGPMIFVARKRRSNDA